MTMQFYRRHCEAAFQNEAEAIYDLRLLRHCLKCRLAMTNDAECKRIQVMG